MFDLKNIDVKLLRHQRDALLTSIDDAEDDPRYAGSETREIREKHIRMLDGLIGMIDDILDAIEIHNFSRPIEMAQHPLFED